VWGTLLTGCQELFVNRSVAFRRALLSAALAALAPSVLAQTAKPPPRLPPTPSQTSQIPGGVDTGTPGGSDSLQLGTPVMSNATGQPGAFKGGSAAARAAARPKSTASSADCTKPLAGANDPKAPPPPLPKPGVAGKVSPPPPAKPPVAPGATRLDC
jgi:hypothetical protein